VSSLPHFLRQKNGSVNGNWLIQFIQFHQPNLQLVLLRIPDFNHLNHGKLHGVAPFRGNSRQNALLSGTLCVSLLDISPGTRKITGKSQVHTEPEAGSVEKEGIHSAGHMSPKMQR
jgi:hypothetical protein